MKMKNRKAKMKMQEKEKLEKIQRKTTKKGREKIK